MRSPSLRGFPVGTEVRVQHPGDPFHRRTGTVSEHNLGEIGVRFRTGEAAVWFLPEDLVVLIQAG